VKNDHEVVAGLKSLENRRFHSGTTSIKFQDVDYNVLSLQDQIKVDLETDIMIGPHGAGLMHSIFMRDRGVLLELHIDNSGANRHFHNLALWSGHKYVTESSLNSNPVNVQELTKVVQQIIEQMDVTSY
jgi:capsular polysaccharide biosynthesis protein